MPEDLSYLLDLKPDAPASKGGEDLSYLLDLKPDFDPDAGAKSAQGTSTPKWTDLPQVNALEMEQTGQNPINITPAETARVVGGIVPKAGQGIVNAVRGGVGLLGQALEGMTSETGPNAQGNPVSRYGRALREEAAHGTVAKLMQDKATGELITPGTPLGRVLQAIPAAAIEFAPATATGMPGTATMGLVSGLHSANTANEDLAPDDPSRGAKMVAATGLGATTGALAGKLMPNTQPLSRAFKGAPWQDGSTSVIRTEMGKWLMESTAKLLGGAAVLTGGQVAEKKITGGQPIDTADAFLQNLATTAGFVIAHGAAQARAGAKSFQTNEDGTFSFKAEAKDPKTGEPVHTWVTAKVDPDGTVKVAVPVGEGSSVWVKTAKIQAPEATPGKSPNPSPAGTLPNGAPMEPPRAEPPLPAVPPSPAGPEGPAAESGAPLAVPGEAAGSPARPVAGPAPAAGSGGGGEPSGRPSPAQVVALAEQAQELEGQAAQLEARAQEHPTVAQAQADAQEAAALAQEAKARLAQVVPLTPQTVPADTLMEGGPTSAGAAAPAANGGTVPEDQPIAGGSGPVAEVPGSEGGVSGGPGAGGAAPHVASPGERGLPDPSNFAGWISADPRLRARSAGELPDLKIPGALAPKATSAGIDAISKGFTRAQDTLQDLTQDGPPDFTTHDGAQVWMQPNTAGGLILQYRKTAPGAKGITHNMDVVVSGNTAYVKAAQIAPGLRGKGDAVGMYRDVARMIQAAAPKTQYLAGDIAGGPEVQGLRASYLGTTFSQDGKFAVTPLADVASGRRVSRASAPPQESASKPSAAAPVTNTRPAIPTEPVPLKGNRVGTLVDGEVNKSPAPSSTIHPKSQTILDKAMAEKDVNLLGQILHPGNQGLRHQFEDRTGVKLPKGWNATRAVISKHYEEDSSQVETRSAIGPDNGQKSASFPGVGPDHPASKFQEFGDYVVKRALEGESLDNTGLRKRSRLYFKDQPSQKDLYDAVELGVNRHILAHPELYDVQKVDIKQVIQNLEGLVSKLPTQTHREAGANEFQQYSTPPFYSAVVSWVADVQPSDLVLEPSAGVGGLAVFPRLAGAEVMVNEFDRTRRAKLLEAMPGWKSLGVEDARFIHAHTQKAGARPTVVVMNPPFSSTSGKVTGKRDSAQGVKHIDSALAALAPGGRLVAIMGDMEGKSWRDYQAKLQADPNVTIQALASVDGTAYRKYGTSFDSVVLVVDKKAPAPNHAIVQGKVANLEDLADLLRGVRDARTASLAQQPDGAPAEQGGRAPAETAGDSGDLRNSAPLAGGAGGSEQLEPARPKGQPDSIPTGAAGGGGKSRPVRTGAAPVSEPAGMGPEAGGKGGPASVRPGKSGPVHADEPGSGSREVSQPVRTPEHPGGAGSQDLRDDHIAEVKATKGKVKAQEQDEAPDSIFSTYRPSKVSFPGAKPHPGELVESQAMAAVDLPDARPTTKLHIPEAVITSGKLSDAQLEAIYYATQATDVVMDDGRRQGFLVGDGTGVGKGREISGFIMSSLNAGQGKGKAVWLSKNSDLFKDATRDWTGIGGAQEELFDLSKLKATEGEKGAKTVAPIPMEKGILFGTYATVTGVKGEVPGARKEQLKAWLGGDFDGVIVLDEAHLASNLGMARTSRGKAKPSQTALGMQEIQAMFPKARVVYVTATVASDPTQLAFLDRLGLWGKGKAFARPADLLAAVQNAGLAGMELVARDLKARGLYIARNLSYNGVNYRTLEHKLLPDQIHAYDIAAGGWQKVLQNVHEVIRALTDDHNSGKAKGAALSKFYGQQQAFFNSLITSLTLPTAFGDMQRALDAGNSVVIQLTETGEARQGRAIEEASQRAKDTGEDLDIASIDLSPKDILIGFLKSGFPVNALEEVEDDNGNKSWVVAKDSEGNPIQDPEAVAKRDALISEIATMKLPGSALDEILKQFGTDQVAEITGRSERRVFLPDGTAKIEKRTDKQVDADKGAFMDSGKRILVFSKAANTGMSFHADNAAGNRTKRIHFVLQGGWNAADAIQGLGRTHRTNQAQPPEYVLVTTDLGGHKRFTSTIARRISQLGALTKGQRQASASLFTEKDNLESSTALHALSAWYDQLMKSGVPLADGSVLTEAEFENATGLALRDHDDQPLLERPPMKKFLNRVLALPVQQQNAVFDSLAARIEEQYHIEEQAGMLEKGLQNIPVVSAKVVEEDPFFKDPDTGAETVYQKIEAQQKIHYLDFEKVNQKAPGFKGFYQDPKRGIPFAVTETRVEMKPDGTKVQHYRMAGPSTLAYRSNIDFEKLEKLEPAKAEESWNAYQKERGDTETNAFHLITGAMLNIWNRFPENLPMDVGRIRLANGNVAMGRIIPESRLSEVLGRIGADKALGAAEKAIQSMKAPDLLKAVLRDGKTVSLANGYRLMPVRRSGEYFAVLDGPPHQTAMQALVRQYPGWRLEQFQGQYGAQYKVVVPDSTEARDSLNTYLKAAPVRNLTEPRPGWVRPREASRGEIADFLGGQQLYEKALKTMGLPEDASLEEIKGAVLTKIRTVGSSAKSTAIRIYNQFKELGKVFADRMAELLHGLNPFQGRKGEIGAIGEDLSSLVSEDTGPRGWQDELSPAQQEALRRVGATKDQPSLKERVKEWTTDLDKKMAQGIVDQFAPIASLDQHAYTLARMTKASDGALEALMLFGNLNLKDGVYDAAADGIGFIEVMQHLQGEQDRFLWWIAANRAEQLKAEGRERLFSESDIEELKNLNDGRMPDGKPRQVIYAKTLAEFNRIGKSVLDIAEQSEIIDPDSRAMWEKEFYVPFYRAIEDGVSGPNIAQNSGLVAQYAFKRLKGGKSKLNQDLMHNTLMNWAHLISAASKNRAAAATLEAAEKMGAATRLKREEKGALWHLGYTEREVEGSNEPVKTHGRVYYSVSDPYLVEALMALESTQYRGAIMKGLSKLKRVFTVGVTANPVFKIRNLMRDSIASVAISGVSPNVLKNVGTGINIMRQKKGQEYASLLASGGIIRFGTMLEGDSSKHLQKLINSGVNKNTIVSTWEHAKDAIQRGIDAYNEVGDWSEGANRAALYRQLREQGLSHAEAAFEARDLLDFSMGGTWQAVRFLTSVTPFLNARIQGLYRLGKGAKARPERFGAMILAIGLASIALMLAYKDDEDWKKREDWDRDNYWWFKAGDKGYRIPKPFEVGAIGTLAERSVEAFVSDEMTKQRFMNRLGATLSDTFAMNPIPQGLRPVLDIYSNKDPFTGRDIEGPNLEKLDKAHRYTNSTSEVGKLAGKAGVLSPVQVDYLVRGYLGWLGTSSLEVTNQVSRPFMDAPQRPERRLSDTFLVGSFAEDLPSNYSRYTTEFYKQAKEIEEAFATSKALASQGNEKALEAFDKSAEDKLAQHRDLVRARKNLSEINNAIRAIENDPKMTPEAKRKELDSLNAMKNEITRDAVASLKSKK